MYKLTVFRKIFSLKLGKIAVVPLVGTWIEIIYQKKLTKSIFVVPLVGTWIEMPDVFSLLSPVTVVPLVGTWIEISNTIPRHTEPLRSFPSWERGLKLQILAAQQKHMRRSPRGNVD